MQADIKKNLKWISLITKIAGLYPGIISLAWFFRVDYDYSKLPVHIIMAALTGCAGYFIMYYVTWIKQKEKSAATENICIAAGYLAGFVIIAGCIICLLPGTKEFKILFLIFTVVMNLTGMVDYSKAYDEIFMMWHLAIATAVYVLAYVISKNSYLVIAYILILAEFGITMNQSVLDGLMTHLSTNNVMAKNTRKDNLKWTMVLVGFMIMIYPFRRYLGKVLSGIVHYILYAAVWLIQFMSELLSLIVPHGEVIEEGEVLGEVHIGGSQPGQDRSGLIMLIILTIIAVIIYRKQLIKGVKYVVSQLVRLIHKTLELFWGKRNNGVYEYADHTDVIEKVGNVDKHCRQKQNITNRRKWRKEVKKYLRHGLDKQDYRKGYRLILQGAMLQGIHLTRSQTPREIMEEINRCIDLKELQQGTRIYEEIRYKEKETVLSEVDKAAYILNQLMDMVR